MDHVVNGLYKLPVVSVEHYSLYVVSLLSSYNYHNPTKPICK